VSTAELEIPTGEGPALPPDTTSENACGDEKPAAASPAAPHSRTPDDIVDEGHLTHAAADMAALLPNGSDFGVVALGTVR